MQDGKTLKKAGPVLKVRSKAGQSGIKNNRHGGKSLSFTKSHGGGDKKKKVISVLVGFCGVNINTYVPDCKKKTPPQHARKI